ncbi:MAG: hypothetical protein ABIZ50_04380 [Solirubrobacterales bacterium]
MASDHIARLRNPAFPTERRGGYSTEAVDDYLREVADWLETGGSDQGRSAIVQREIERVGQRTGSILAAAQDTADRITAEAEEDAKELREAARSEAAEVRLGADAEAKRKLDEALGRLQQAGRYATERTAQVEGQIAELSGTREAIIANLEELASGIRTLVDGPGSADLDLPGTAPTAVEGADPDLGGDEQAGNGPEPTAESEADPPETDVFETAAAADPRLDDPEEHGAEEPDSEEPDSEVIAGEPDQPELKADEPDDEPDEQVSEVEREVESEVESDPPEPAEGELPATEFFDVEAEEEALDDDEEVGIDTEARERARQLELERRRNPQNTGDQPTEDSNLADLL